MIMHFPYKVHVIPMREENFLVIVSLIIDMVSIVRFKIHGAKLIRLVKPSLNDNLKI